ncbi:MAG: M48 family metalloprotease, partial [Gammaproteobacteria bacterium]|nr:M48 family metalloprotease [Gammaproteobacteria bacterium]
FLPELRTQSAQQLFNVLGTSLIRGYGRGHELEADRLGAEYLARSGYDPDAMIEVIGVLKNQETAEQQLAAQEGREPRVYHGLFATHPSNDRRLQEVVGEARKFKTGAATSIGRDAYLDRIDGLRFGDSPNQGIRRGNLFYHEELDFKLTFPAGWRLENYPDRLEAASPDNQAQMLVLAQDRNRRISPREFIVTRLNQSNLTQGRELDIDGLEAYTGIGRFDTVFGRRDTRVTVLYYQDKAYIFLGAVRSGPVTARDDDFLATPRSFRSLGDADRRYARGLSLRVVQTGPAERISDLAARSAPMNYPELQLRLINDLFPGGEPQPAQRVKIVQ